MHDELLLNLFNIRTHAQQLRELVNRGLFDEQYEVRMSASVTLWTLSMSIFSSN